MTGIAALILAGSTAGSSGTGCFESIRVINAGAAIARDDIIPVTCRDAATPRLRYDSAVGGAVAVDAVAAHAYLGRVVVATSRTAPRGTKLMLRSAIGPVTIERPVTLLQAARSGGRAFVRDDRGEVFSVPVHLEEVR